MVSPEEYALWLEKKEREALPHFEVVVAECLSNLIKYSPHLHHLDLVACGLTKYIFKEIAKALRKSRSLVGIHLSENPGLTDETKTFLFDRVHAKKSDFDNNNIIDLKVYEARLKRYNPLFNHKLL